MTQLGDRPIGRRFWNHRDVVEWLNQHCTFSPGHDPHDAAEWWCVYRNAEALMDDTIRHVAQAIHDGIGPFGLDDVDYMVQGWLTNEGEESDTPGRNQVIDDLIEADLRKFFADTLNKEETGG